MYMNGIHKKVIVCIFCMYLSVAFQPAVYAGIVLLNDGSHVEGDIIAEDAQTITVKVQYGEIVIEKSRLAHVPSLPPSVPDKEEPPPPSRRKVKTLDFSKLPDIGMSFHEEYKGEHFFVYLPSAYLEKKKLPLIVGLDPVGNGKAYVKMWEREAEARGYAVVCPGNAGKHWEFGDARRIIEVTKHVVQKYKIDPRRVYISGFSGGGLLAYYCAIKRARYFAAAAPLSVGGDIRPFFRTASKRRVPFLIVVGENDEDLRQSVVLMNYKVLKARGHIVKYEKIEGMGHEFRLEQVPMIIDFFDKYKKR